MRLPKWQGIVSNTTITEMLNLTQLQFSATFSADESIVFCTPNLILPSA